MKPCIRNILIFVAFILCPGYLFSQITTEELPPSFYEPGLISQKKLASIEAPDLKKIQAEDAINDSITDIIERFAVAIPVNLNSKQDGEWKTSPKGDLIWHLTLVVKNAQSLDLTFDKFWLPEKGKFFLYNPESKQTIGAITSEFLRGSKEHPADFSTAIIYGDSLSLEYYQPSSLKEMPVISISKIYYGYRYTHKYKTGTKGFDDSGDCQVNVNCSEGQNWQNEKRAIARIAAKFPSDEAWCTGALINNTSNNLQPLFLTANHNLLDIFDAISNPNLSLWIFYWGYEFPGCNDQAGEPTLKSTTGATVLANNPSSDFALFELIQDPKNLNNFSPYYLGWDRSGNAGTGGVVIHHPEGDVKKIATYNITPGNTDCYTPGSNYWKLNFQSTPHGWSITEFGSSGSPLINNNKKIIGQLRGPGICLNPNCSYPEEDISSYGKFSMSWTGDSASDSRRRLNHWLDPLGTNPSVLNGRSLPSYTGSNVVCSWGTAISLINLPPNSTIQWYKGPHLARVSTQGSNPCTFSSTESGVSWVSATINLSGGGSITLPQFKVWSGAPIFTSVSGPNPPYIYKGCTGLGYTFWANPSRDPDSQSSYTWMVQPSYLNWYFQYQDNDWVTIVFNDPSDYYQVITRASNICGQSNWLYKSVEIMDCYYFSIYPNPASDYVTITATLPDIDTDFKIPSDYKIKITDNSGVIIYSATKSGESFTIPVNDLIDGNYVVTIIFDDKIESMPLVIKH